MTAGQLTLHDAILQREASEDQAVRDDATPLPVDEVALAAVRAVRMKQQVDRPTEGSFVPCLQCGRMTRLGRSGVIEKCGWCGKGKAAKT